MKIGATANAFLESHSSTNMFGNSHIDAYQGGRPRFEEFDIE
jgi:hypothetical protein